MKKTIRLTESDLVRLVKRVISEGYINEAGFSDPLNLFYKEYEDKGYTVLFGNKDGKTISEPLNPNKTYSHDNEFYIYVGKPNTSVWKFYEKDKLRDSEGWGVDNKVFDELLNWDSKQWKIVKDPTLIKKLNVYGGQEEKELRTYCQAGQPCVYRALENNPTTEELVRFLKNSNNLMNDSEADAEAVFMAIKNVTKYNEVKKLLGKDPYQFAKSFMNTSKKYHKEPIDDSMRRLGLLK